MALFAMPAGVRGEALFSKEEPPLFRYSLRRCWGPINKRDARRFILFIGHNPSDANHRLDDPTIRKECKFARDLGYNDYHKVNIADRISREPAELEKVAPRELISIHNKARILRAASEAHKIVCCWGNTIPALQLSAETTEAMLRAEGHTLYTFIINYTDASPKHPLYIKDGTPLCEFRADRQPFKPRV